MRTRNHFRLAATLVTFSLTATAHGAPPSGPDKSQPSAPTLMARASGPIAPTSVRSAAPASVPDVPSAVPDAKPPTAVERAAIVRAAEVKLGSEDVEAVEQGFAQLAQVGGADVIKIVVARVRRGLPPQLIEPALTALVSFKQASVSPVLLELALHRRWQVRQQAIDALGKLGVKSAQPAMLYALDDPSDQVRASAVQTLGMIGDARALPALTVAMNRKVEGAALALGKLGQAKEVELLLEHARKGELAQVEAGLHEMLLRKNLPVQHKLKIVAGLAQMSSPAANEILTVWAQTWTGNDPRVLQALTASSKTNNASPRADKSAAVAVQGAKQ